MRTQKIITEIQLGEKFNANADFEILTTAKQTDARYGDFKYTKENLEEMANNFNEDIVGTEIAVDLNHDREGIALAWIKPGTMSVRPSTKLDGEFSLYAKLYKFTPDGEKMVSTGALRYFSVELQFAMKKVVEGIKKTFKNVIRGLALTNRPVIKDMSPTFSEKSNNLSNPLTMEDLKKLFASLTGKDSVTKVEFSEFTKLADDAVEAEPENKEEVEAMKDDLEPKVEEEKEPTEEEKAAAEKAEAEKAEAEKAEAEKTEEAKEEEAKEMAEKALAEKAEQKTFTLAEVKELITKPMKKMNETLAELRGTRLSEEVKSLMLSEDNKVGFKAGAKDKVLDFVKKLSDELAKEYFALHTGIIGAVDLAEYGSAENGKVELSEPHKELDEKATKLAEEKGVSYSAATKTVLTEDKELAEAIQKLEDSNK